MDSGEAGDNIGALLRGVERDDVERGQVLCKPGSITPHTEFECQAYILKKRRRRKTYTVLYEKYRPQFYFRTTDVTGEVTLPSGTEMVMPGDDGKIFSETNNSNCHEREFKFCNKRGGKTVGAGE